MTTKAQLSSLWDRLKVEASAKWKNEQEEEVQAFKAFCSHFERYNYEDLRRGIEYVIKHLIRNGWDWPSTAIISNAINTNRVARAGSVEDSNEFKQFRLEQEAETQILAEKEGLPYPLKTAGDVQKWIDYAKSNLGSIAKPFSMPGKPALKKPPPIDREAAREAAKKIVGAGDAFEQYEKK